MSQVLWALLEPAWELVLGLLLQDLLVFGGDPIPKFGFSEVEEVNSRELHVLSVPAKEGLP